jgi:NTE family protein
VCASLIQIGDHTYVDGGAHSPTNAAILHELDLDLVIVVSPMSGPMVGLPIDLYGAARRHARRLATRRSRRCVQRGSRSSCSARVRRSWRR